MEEEAVDEEEKPDDLEYAFVADDEAEAPADAPPPPPTLSKYLSNAALAFPENRNFTIDCID